MEFAPEFMPDMHIINGYLYEQVIIIILLQTYKDLENLWNKLGHGFFVQLNQDVPESESGAQTRA